MGVEEGLDFFVQRRLWFDAGQVADVQTPSFGLWGSPVRGCVGAVPAIECRFVVCV